MRTVLSALGQLASRLLSEALAGRRKKPSAPAFEWTARAMGALIDLADKDPGIFSAPLTPAEALRNVDALVSLPHVRLLAEGDGFLEVYREVTGGFPVRGNLVPDAHLVALLRLHGVRTLYTRDGDFRKFPFLEVRDPFVA